MTQVSLEFLVEPFVEGAPGPHVRAAVEAAEQAGLAVELGPFASVATGPVDTVADAVARLLREAFRSGATRVQLQVDRA
ncbi:MAG TPA: thiamine-binding protein [Acidimicrobiales bacterium]|jgi:uncharacterized protein YqgV (UPF0045/DUF77 family)